MKNKNNNLVGYKHTSITALIRERERKSQSHFFFPSCLSQPNSHYLLLAAWKDILGLRYRYKWACRRLAICLKLHWIAFCLLWIPDVPYSSGCSHHKKGKWVCVLVIGWVLGLVCFCLFEKTSPCIMLYPSLHSPICLILAKKLKKA